MIVETYVRINDGEFDTLMKKFALKTKDLNKPMRSISTIMKREVLKNFTSQGRPEKWKKLSRNYLKYKLRKKSTNRNRILEFHGRLKQSINSRSDGTMAAVFTGEKYGVFHQTGTGRLPARPFMPDDKHPDMPPFNVDCINKFREILLGHLLG